MKPWMSHSGGAGAVGVHGLGSPTNTNSDAPLDHLDRRDDEVRPAAQLDLSRQIVSEIPSGKSFDPLCLFPDTLSPSTPSRAPRNCSAAPSFILNVVAHWRRASVATKHDSDREVHHRREPSRRPRASANLRAWPVRQSPMPTQANPRSTQTCRTSLTRSTQSSPTSSTPLRWTNA